MGAIGALRPGSGAKPLRPANHPPPGTEQPWIQALFADA